MNISWAVLATMKDGKSYEVGQVYGAVGRHIRLDRAARVHRQIEPGRLDEYLLAGRIKIVERTLVALVKRELAVFIDGEDLTATYRLTEKGTVEATQRAKDLGWMEFDPNEKRTVKRVLDDYIRGIRKEMRENIITSLSVSPDEWQSQTVLRDLMLAEVPKEVGLKLYQVQVEQGRGFKRPQPDEKLAEAGSRKFFMEEIGHMVERGLLERKGKGKDAMLRLPESVSA